MQLSFLSQGAVWQERIFIASDLHREKAGEATQTAPTSLSN